MGRGDHPKTILLIVLFSQSTPKCLKVIGGGGGGGGVVVAHKILLSAPVPISPLFFFGFGTGIGPLGTGIGTRA